MWFSGDLTDFKFLSLLFSSRKPEHSLVGSSGFPRGSVIISKLWKYPPHHQPVYQNKSKGYLSRITTREKKSVLLLNVSHVSARPPDVSSSTRRAQQCIWDQFFRSNWRKVEERIVSHSDSTTSQRHLYLSSATTTRDVLFFPLWAWAHCAAIFSLPACSIKTDLMMKLGQPTVAEPLATWSNALRNPWC